MCFSRDSFGAGRKESGKTNLENIIADDNSGLAAQNVLDTHDCGS